MQLTYGVASIEQRKLAYQARELKPSEAPELLDVLPAAGPEVIVTLRYLDVNEKPENA